MHIVKYGVAICLCLMVFSAVGYASDDVGNMEIRPTFGYGYASTKSEHGMGYHAGARIMSNASPTKRAGVELSYVSPFGFNESLKRKNYIAAGIILEKVLREQFVLSIGTIGYIGIDQNKNNPFGAISGIGWEPKVSENIQLSVALRLESIFDTSTINRYSLSAGVKF